jgi:hypothetical protein
MAVESQGTIFFWSTSTAASTAAAVAIAQVVGFNGPSGNANVIDASHLGSTAKEKMIGLRDEGQVSLDVNFLPTDGGQTALRADRASRTMRKAVIKLNDNTSDAATTKITFDAYVSGFSITGAVDQVVKGNITLEITGACTYSSVIT